MKLRISVRNMWLAFCLFILTCLMFSKGNDDAVDYLTKNNLLQGKAEVVFLLDRSGSVGAANFEIQKGFVESLLTQVVVDTNATRVAVITYSKEADRHIDYLRDPKSKCFLSLELQDVTYQDSGSTNIAGALEEARLVFKNAREGVNKVVILISDGLATHGGDPTPVAEKLKKDGVQIFTFGIGRFLKSQLLSLASSPHHTYSCLEFRDFKRLAHKIRGDARESEWSGDISSDSCDHLCDNPYKGQEDNPGCCDPQVAKCSCALLSGTYTCVCKAGYYGFSGLWGKCKACPKGTYKSKLEPANRCTNCPKGSTTDGIASTSVKDCHCKVGFQGNPADGTPCTIMKCPPLQAPTNGYLLGSCNNEYNSECFFECNEGYELTNDVSQLRTCGADGEWIGPAAVCQKIRCPSIPAPKFGRKSCNSKELTIGTWCTFNCDPGFLLEGATNRTCLSSKSWSKTETFCRAKTCPSVPSLKYGKVINCLPNKKPTFGDTCIFLCNEGFELQGPTFLMCNENGQLATPQGSVAHPKCIDIEKPRLKCPQSMKVKTEPGGNFALVTWNDPEPTDNDGFQPKLEVIPTSARKFPVKLPMGRTIVSYSAKDKSELVSKCEMTIDVIDKEPPMVVSCPDKVAVNTTDVKVSVEWEEPVFKDNSGLNVSITKNANPGDDFTPGRHIVEYFATDPSGNKASCRFDLIVTQNSCPFHPAPANGAFTCEDWMYGQFCQAYCNEKYDFSFTPAEWYICNSNAEWETLPEGLDIPWPDCTSLHIPTSVRRMMKGFYYSGDCNDPSVKNAIEKVFLDHFRSTFNASQFCVKEGSCTIEMVRVRCGSVDDDMAVASNRVRRDIWQQVADGTLEVEFEINLDPGETLEFQTMALKLKELLAAIDDLSWDVEESVNGENVADEVGKIVMTSGETILLCESGSFLRGEECVLCPVGTYYENTTSTCVECPFNEYQDEEGQVECKLCPLGTATEEARCKNETECKEICPPGTYSPNGLESCLACPLGTFQSNYGQTECEACPEGFTTWTESATGINWCHPTCEPGSYSATGLYPCLPCSRGYYQPLRGRTECEECLGNLTTLQTGSTTLEECIDYDFCSQVECQNGGHCTTKDHEIICICQSGFKGFFCEEDIDDCANAPCANGATCVDLVESFHCECPIGFAGEICDEELNECLPQPCLNGGTCIDQISGFLCLCPPEYEGHLCDARIDLCARLDPCLNEGRCHLEDHTPICHCSEGFTGPDCSVNIDDCLAVTCYNGGSCVDEISSYYCVCPQGYNGSHCEEDVDECSQNNCRNGSTCLDLVAGYQCICAPGWSGAFCDYKMDSNFVLAFPQEPTVTNRAQVTITSPLSSATVSMWVQTTDVQRPGTPLSYAAATVNTEVDNALTVSDCEGLKVYVNNQPLLTDLQLADGHWHQVTFSWSSTDGGSWQIYEDGKLKSEGSNFQSGHPIPGGGTLILGQEQDSVGGGFSPLESFTGNISRVNVWSHVLSHSDVSRLCDLDDDISGKVVSWPDFLGGLHGDVGVIDGERPHFVK